jgi:hypothetical protein
MTITQLVAALVVSATPAAAAHAQTSPRSDSARTFTDTATAGTIALAIALGQVSFNTPVAVARGVTSRSAAPFPSKSSAEVRSSKTMMTVGVAALITGAVIGGKPGTVFMVGGGVVGLVGLYKYLQ